MLIRNPENRLIMGLRFLKIISLISPDALSWMHVSKKHPNHHYYYDTLQTNESFLGVYI
jgi:hypothetical protein